MVPEVITAGRDFERKALFSFLSSTPSIKGIKASTATNTSGKLEATGEILKIQLDVTLNEKGVPID